MKIKLGLLLGGLVLLGQAAMAANSTTLTLTATVPTASSIGFTVNSIDITSKTWTLQSTTTLGFLPAIGMNYVTANGANIYAPSNYFAIDIAPVGGSGTPNTTVTYTEGTNPNGTTNGLGTKAGATFDKEVYVTSSSNSETAVAVGNNGKLMLSQLSSTNISNSLVNGGWLRMYLGICTGNTNAANGPVDPTGCKPFTTNDAQGQYTGSLLISATVA